MKNLSLSISYSSPYELEEVIRKHPEVEDEYNRVYSEALREQKLAELELEILIGEIVEEICGTRNVPASAKSEVRRTEVPLDKRYKKLKIKCIEAETKANILKGSTKSASARGYCLTELARMTLRSMGGPAGKDQQYLNYNVNKDLGTRMDYDKED